jgi:signal transduction histidine kinase
MSKLIIKTVVSSCKWTWTVCWIFKIFHNLKFIAHQITNTVNNLKWNRFAFGVPRSLEMVSSSSSLWLIFYWLWFLLNMIDTYSIWNTCALELEY